MYVFVCVCVREKVINETTNSEMEIERRSEKKRLPTEDYYVSTWCSARMRVRIKN